MHPITRRLKETSLSARWFNPITVYEIKNEEWDQMGTSVLLITYSLLTLQLNCRRKAVSTHFTEQADLRGELRVSETHPSNM